MMEEIKRVKADLGQARDKVEKLLVRSPSRGNFILVDPRRLIGRFVKKGELLGYIINDHRPTVRAVVRQEDMGLVRKQLRQVRVRLAEQTAIISPASVQRIVPAAITTLPSPALGVNNGGNILVDPSDPEGLRVMDTIFQVDISLSETVKNVHVGQRVYVRFEHGTMPLAAQWYRRLRQLFLRNFYV